MYDNPPTMHHTSDTPATLIPAAKKIFVTYSPALLVKKQQYNEHRQKGLCCTSVNDTDSNGPACNDMSLAMSMTRDTGHDMESLADGLASAHSLPGDASPSPSAQPTSVTLDQLFQDTEDDHISATGFELISNQSPYCGVQLSVSNEG